MADRYPRQLSGGQQQRVGVARALAADPPVLLMDEPFGAVDPIVRGALQQEFRALQRELGKTVVFVTHDVDEAVLLGDRIAVMQQGGQIAQFGPPDELLAQPGERVRRRRSSAARAGSSCSRCAGGEVPATEVGPDGIAAGLLRTGDGAAARAWRPTRATAGRRRSSRVGPAGSLRDLLDSRGRLARPRRACASTRTASCVGAVPFRR